MNVNRDSEKIQSDFLEGCAKLMKRSTFDGHACDFDSLARKIYATLMDEEIQSVITSLPLHFKKKKTHTHKMAEISFMTK